MSTLTEQSKPQATDVRRARLEDHSDLIAIGDGFNGLDYMKHSFPKYLQNPNMYCYVQICNDTPVSILLQQ